jgi:dTDP-glucose 4,6-dehydratase
MLKTRNLKTILITGGAGFIGSNFISYFIEKYPDYFVVNLDKLTYAGNLQNLTEVSHNPRYRLIKGDICSKNTIRNIFSKFDVRGVIHFAAESHVDNSIRRPAQFIKTNVMGTFNLLEAARSYWMEKPFSYKGDYKGCRFHHISTDEVYGSLGPTGYFTEKTPYAPNSPYSATKAASDMIVRAYGMTYGLDATTTNCSNNYGPKQHREKLIPTIIRNGLASLPIPIYGDGKNVRDWLYVHDHCTGIDLAYHYGVKGEIYNIGGHSEMTNIEIALKICSILDKEKPLNGGRAHSELISYVEDRAGHDRRYAIDASKIERELGWKRAENFDSGIVKTVKWYLDNPGWL